MAKTEFLQIRFSPQDRQRVIKAAGGSYLDPSTWARQAILKALDEWEANGKGSPNASTAADKTRAKS